MIGQADMNFILQTLFQISGELSYYVLEGIGLICPEKKSDWFICSQGNHCTLAKI